MFFKNILGGPDLNPLPNDVSDARPELGACQALPVAIINLKFNVTNSSVSLLYFGLVEGKNFDFETSKKNFVFFTYLSQILLQIDARNISIKYTKWKKTFFQDVHVLLRCK